jgi:hypothetical protein
MPRCPTRPCPEPERARSSSGNRSGRRVRRSGGSGAGSAGSREMRSSGCASSRDFLPWQRRSTRCREKKRKRKATGGRHLPRGGSLRPPHREPWRRRRSKRLRRARKRPPPSGLRRRRRTPQRCRQALRRHRCAPRRRMEARRWRRRPWPQRPPSPRGRGNLAFPP